MNELTDSEILRAVQEEIAAVSSRAQTAGVTTYQESSQQVDSVALDYYWGRRPAISQQEKESSMCDFVSTDVSDGIHATMAEIMPAFQGNSPVEFSPNGPQDEDQAAIESDIVNHAVMGLGRGYMEIQAAIKDLLLLRRGQIKVWVEEKVEVEYETHENVPEHVLPAILQPKREDEQVEIVGQETVQEAQTAEGYDDYGNYVADIQVSPAVYTLEIRRKWIDRKFRVKATPKDELLVNKDHSSWNLDEARFVCHQRVCSKSELISLGVDPELLEEAKRYTHSTGSDKNARKRSAAARDANTGHESTDPYLLSECWYYIDADGDGIAERRHIWVVGDESANGVVVMNQPTDAQPFALGQAYLGFYDTEGVSLFDTLKIVQDIKTKIIRQIINMNQRILKGRLEVVDDDSVNIDDLEDSVDGGYVRVKRLGQISTLPEPRPAPEAYQLLELMDAKRRESGGSAVDSATQAMQVSADTWRGLERAMSVIEQVNAMVARTISETLVKSLYLKAHETLRKNWGTEITARIAGNWVSQDPSQWQMRDDVSARIGLSSAERNQAMQALSGVVQNLMMLAEKGSVIADENRLHEAMVDQIRYSGISDPSQYYCDPKSPEGQQKAQQNAQNAQAQAQKADQMAAAQMQTPIEMERIRAEGRLVEKRMQNQQDMIELQAKTIADMEKHSKDLAFKYDQLAAELSKLNAQFDNEPVPDSVAQLRRT